MTCKTKTIRILATSDLHGKMLPWEYALNAESPAGSMAQLATAVEKYRTPDSLLVDAGDTIQENFANLFVGTEDVHPMVQALNAIGYDIWVAGNHDYNYGMDTLRKTIADIQAKVLTGNVRDEQGKPVADGWTIMEVGGVRVAVIGMVTPVITLMDTANLENCAVTDPLEETRKIISSIRGRYDVLLGVFHMGIKNEFGISNTGVTDILNACPEFDVMIASHEHKQIPSMEINGVLVTENKAYAQTLSVVDLTLEKAGDGWKITGKQAESVDVGSFGTDPALTEMFAPYHRIACEDAETVVARLEGGPMLPEDETEGVPAVWVQDSAMADLIHRVQTYYTGARVSALSPNRPGSNLYPGRVRKCDLSVLYRFENSLYKLRMNGAQLKKYMEWAVLFFNTRKPGERISFNKDVQPFNYDQFDGVCYEVDISREPGSRIRNLRWPDGTPVEDGDEFDIAVCSYRACTQLLIPGVIFEEGGLPKLLQADVHSELGGIREMILAYVTDVMGGVIVPECDNNWKLTGIE